MPNHGQDICSLYEDPATHLCRRGSYYIEKSLQVFIKLTLHDSSVRHFSVAHIG